MADTFILVGNVFLAGSSDYSTWVADWNAHYRIIAFLARPTASVNTRTAHSHDRDSDTGACQLPSSPPSAAASCLLPLPCIFVQGIIGLLASPLLPVDHMDKSYTINALNEMLWLSASGMGLKVFPPVSIVS